MTEQPIVKISVRNLVEFILREGDIDNRIAGGADKEAMQLGNKIHRKIQRQMGSDYHAEVPLKVSISCEGFELLVEGRADGIIKNESGVVIDEIKGVLKELQYISKPVEVHLAQAKCYAYIYASQMKLSTIGIQMTYCDMKTEETKRFQEYLQMDYLEAWFLGVVRKYEKWALFKIKWKQTRNRSIKNIEFPFSYREGQKELVTSVYRTIIRKKKLFIQAPTGVGKTMASIFPAVKAIGEEQGDKIFYLTAKTITRTVAEQAFATLKEQQLELKVITLTAKEKLCFCEETECNPQSCSYARGHYDRVNDAVFEMLNKDSKLGREVIETYAKQFNVCPFEMMLDAAIWVDAVICDYNYLFDPNAQLRRFFSEGIKEDYLFLIDEAHNLVDRGRDMYSASIYKEDMLAVKGKVKYYDLKFARSLEVCNKQLLELKRECENYQIHEGIGHLALSLMNVMMEMERFMETVQDEEIRKTVLELYFSVRSFLNIYDKLDKNYIIYTELESDGRFKLKLFCVNPAACIQECLDCGNATIFFSATLLPINYYKQLLSTEQQNYAIYANTPFDSANRLLVLGGDVSTKYTKRNTSMYNRFAEYIVKTVDAKRGNYLVFFPSYRFMEDVYDALQKCMLGDIQFIKQLQNMNEEKRAEFLEEFEKERKGSLVGLGVMGGIFSEGIDLVNEKLIGALIIGTGIPQICNEREILKQYFDDDGKRGFDYAYLYPGVNKVLQAAGRVIRTDEDKGIILLLDERFMGRQYQEIFPKEWNRYETCDIGNIGSIVEEFWSER